MVAPVVAAIRTASVAAGRPLDPDHYGAGFTFRFGSWDEPAVERGAKALSRLVPGIAPRDYMAVGTVAVLTLVSAAAGMIPARRASRIDPILALRYE